MLTKQGYDPDWQKQYEPEISRKYMCGVTGHECINCSPHGCEHRKPRQ